MGIPPEPHRPPRQPDTVPPAQQHPAEPPEQEPLAEPLEQQFQPNAAAPDAPRFRRRYVAPGNFATAGKDSSPFGLPGRPRGNGRRKLWTVLGIVGGALLLVIIGVVILVNVAGGATNKARGLADNFTKLVIAGESSRAYDDYLDPALKEQLSKEDFIAGVQSLQMDDTCKTAYDNLKVSSDNGTNAAEVTGHISCKGDKNIDLAYRFAGRDELRMMDIKLKPKV
ncbi:hypothetical protein QFZ40_002634 [Arthrobacter pascens]|uniref:hypothetical protein n=1 Tax=Arthrobacter pascens TaxID=1677 RepID=UPI00277F828A|nr:hypothetical protein [Arthrobacter pascens]MDQ0634725.1 hypothetical protein [Arthrobacter pascens]